MPLRLRNTEERYGAVAIWLHWSMAILIILLFPLGIYMTGLPYVNPWYTTAPHLHKSFGIILFILLVLRTIWRRINSTPEINGPLWEKVSARIIHASFYILLFIITLNGYLIPTANGNPVELFNWLAIPAIIPKIENQGEIAGAIHYKAAVVLMILIALHTLAALKRHFIDKDPALKNMLGIKK